MLIAQIEPVSNILFYAALYEVLMINHPFTLLDRFPVANSVNEKECSSSVTTDNISSDILMHYENFVTKNGIHKLLRKVSRERVSLTTFQVFTRRAFRLTRTKRKTFSINKQFLSTYPRYLNKLEKP